MIEQILNQCTVEGNNVKLPQTQLDRDVYLEVADKLKKIGGKWVGGKVQAFVFDHDPSELLTDIQNGKNRNVKIEFQFFETPERLARRLIELAGIHYFNSVLEPSAGEGAIIRELPPCETVYYCEIEGFRRKSLIHISFFNKAVCLGADFLQIDESQKFDRIVANPPFSKNQDIDHIRKMYAVLVEGGRLVSVASKHWQISSNRKETEFRNWLNEIGAEIHEIEAGTFKESGTNISAVIVVIEK